MIDLNTASAEELDAIPALKGHGFEVVRYREERGRRYEHCRTLAAERFPAFEALDGIEKRLLMKRCKAKRA